MDKKANYSVQVFPYLFTFFFDIWKKYQTYINITHCFTHFMKAIFPGQTPLPPGQELKSSACVVHVTTVRTRSSKTIA